VDELRNSGDAAKFNFKAGKLENQAKTAMKQMNAAFYGDGSAPNAFDGLDKLASSNASAQVVGNINPLTYSWWRNVSVSGAKALTAYDNLRNALRTGYNRSAAGDEGNAPTHGLLSVTDFGGYESLLIANEQYSKEGTKQQGANGGFDNDGLYFKKTLLRPDVACPDGDAWLFSSKFLKFVYYAFLQMQKPVDPGNQLVTSYRVGTYAQLVTSNRRRLVRIYGIN
jgi:hypothetical protein